MKQTNKYWLMLKKKSPKILAVLGSLGTGVTAYLAAKNEATYQHKRFDYYLEHGMFPEELSDKDLTKDEIRKKSYAILGTHLKQHTTTFISGAISIGSILYGNILGEKQSATLLAMNVGIGNAIAKRNEAESNAIQKLPKNAKPAVTKEDIQDYLINEAYHNDLVYYTTINNLEEGDELVWLDIYPENKIFIVKKDDISSLQWFINTTLKEQNYVSYGEIFDYLNIYGVFGPDFVDNQINEWICMYGFSKREDDVLNIEVYARPVTVNEGVTVTALSFSSLGNVIELG